MNPRLPKWISAPLLAATVATPTSANDWLIKPGHFAELTEPPCSYCITEHRKGKIDGDDRVVAWIRGVHNGGAFPLKLFLSGTRIVNDTYGLFIHDTDGGYVSVFPKNYGFTFHGWRKGVMVVRGPDGTLWSGLSGRALEGPQAGARFARVPSLVTTWEHWLLLHPESTTYDLLDGNKYPPVAWPDTISAEARATMGRGDPRLPAEREVLGVEAGTNTIAFALASYPARHCENAELGGQPMVVFWLAATRTATAYDRRIDGRNLTFHVDPIAPETAPFKDRETGTRWSIAGRGLDGPLRGRELNWLPNLQCRWYAWAAEYPDTQIGDTGTPEPP